MLSDFLVYLSNLFSFDDSHPLLFTQFHFWAFFLFVYIGFCLIVSVGEKRSRLKLIDKPTGQRISGGEFNKSLMTANNSMSGTSYES